MSLTLQTVFVADDDLAILTEAAKTMERGSVDEIMRIAVHRAALSLRKWKESIDAPRFASGQPDLADRVDEILAKDLEDNAL